MWPCDPHIPRPAPRPQAGNPVPGRTVPPTPPNVHYNCVYTYTQVWPGSENTHPYIWERVPSWRPIFSGARRAHHRGKVAPWRDSGGEKRVSGLVLVCGRRRGAVSLDGGEVFDPELSSGDVSQGFRK